MNKMRANQVIRRVFKPGQIFTAAEAASAYNEQGGAYRARAPVPTTAVEIGRFLWARVTTGNSSLVSVGGGFMLPIDDEEDEGAMAAPEPVATAAPEPVASTEPEPVASTEPEPVATAAPEPVASTEPEPEPVATAAPEPVASTEPEPDELAQRIQALMDVGLGGGINERRVRQSHARLNGSSARFSYDWPSRVLHDMPTSMQEGIDVERLKALADFIEELPMPAHGQLPPAAGPIATMQDQRVDSRREVHGLILSPGGAGVGKTQYVGGRAGGREGVPHTYLSPFGIVLWGWGPAMNISAVADDENAQSLMNVLTCEPVRLHLVTAFGVSMIEPFHVAAAIRHFCECRDADRAWVLAARAERPATAAARGDTSIPPRRASPAPRAAVAAAPRLTVNEEWKTLMLSEQWPELAAMAEARVTGIAERLAKADERLEGQIAALRKAHEEETAGLQQERGAWHKRHLMALAAIGD